MTSTDVIPHSFGNLSDLPIRTIVQPYAWAIFNGLKWYETTSRPVRLRGRVCIHAAAGTPPRMLLDFLTAIAQTEHARDMTDQWVKSLPTGVILGTVEITGCVPVESLRGQLPATERAFGDYSDGRWACALANPIRFPAPLPAKGKQGWWYYGGISEPHNHSG